ncbi:MAG: hypothetical protein IKY83_01560 [Proteobacteria bacterium]|nr:hypothetical protein [Pseudomonadota bacterium]
MFVAIFLFSGCAKPKDLYEAGVPQWELRTPNPLLNYVPDDAVFVIANQRELGQQNAIFNKFLKKVGREMDLPDGLGLDKLIEDYKDVAPEWGLDPDGNVDFAAYIHGNNTLVIHVTVKDEKIALGHSKRIIQELVKAGVDVGLMNYEFLENQGVRQQWQIHHLSDASGYSVNWGVHCFDNVITFVMYKGTDPVPDYVLSAPKNPLSLGKLDEKTFLVAHIDHAGFSRFLLSWPHIENEINRMYLYRYVSLEDTKRFRKKCEEHLEYCYPLNQDKVFADHVCDGDNTECYSLWHDSDDDSDEVFNEADWNDVDNLPYCLDDREHETDTLKREKKLERRKELRKQIAEIKAKSEQLPGVTELIKEVGSTSIGDAVCMQEVASLFEDSPSSDWALVGSDSGLFGVRVTQKIGSEDLNKKLHDATSAYVDYYHSDALLSIAMGMNLPQMYALSREHFRTLISKKWQCQQIAGFMDNYREKMDKKLFGLESAVYQYILPVSLSAKLVHMSKEFDNIDFLGTVQFASQDALISLDKLLDHKILGEDQDGSEHSIDFKGLDLKTLAVGADLLFGSSNYKLTDVDLSKRKQGHLFDLFINRFFLNEIFEREIKKYDLSIPSYRMLVDLNKNDLTLAVLPVD